jgi:tetratricopeptide (TPR) repeat protein
MNAATCRVELANVLIRDKRSTREAETEYLEALKRWQQLVTEFPTNRWYRHELANNLDNLGGFYERTANRAEKAESCYRQALTYHEQLIREDPNDADSRERLARTQDTLVQLLTSAGRWPQLVDLAKRAVVLAPHNGRLWSMLGASYYRAGEHAKAVRTLTHSLSLNGANADDFLLLAMAHWQQGQKEEARQWFKAAVLRMQHGAHYVWSTSKAIQFGQEAKALLGLDPTTPAASQIIFDDPEWYSRIIAAEPEAAWAYQLRGQIHRRSGNTQRADADARFAYELLTRNLPTGPDALKDLEQAGAYYMQLNSWDMVIIVYSKAIELKNDEFWFYNERGFAHLVLAQYRDAAIDYTKVIALNPRRAQAYARRGFAFLRSGEPEKALVDYAKVLELKPNYSGWDGWSRHCATVLGNGLREWKDGEAVVAVVEKLVRDFPDEPRYAQELRIIRAAIVANFIATGRLSDAEKQYSQAIKQKPNDATPWFRRGEFYVRLGLLELAAADFAKGFELQAPSSLHLWFCHALLRVQVGDAEGYRKVAAQLPQHFKQTSGDGMRGRNELARALTLAQTPDLDLDWAARQAEVAVQKDVGPWSDNALGFVRYRAGKYEQALGPLREALRRDSHWRYGILSNSVLAMAYHRLDRADEARQALTEAAQKVEQWQQSLLGHSLDPLGGAWWDVLEGLVLYREAKVLLEGSAPPDDPRALVVRARSFAALGDQNKAIELYRQAIELDPKLAAAHGNLGLTLLDQGKLEAAVAECRMAAELNPKSASLHYNLGNALLQQGNRDEAVAAYRKALALSPDHAEAHCNLGHALRQQGKFRQALEELRRGHELGSKRPGWPYPSAEWVRRCERLVELDEKLPSFLEGKATPASAAECTELAQFCYNQRRHRAAVRFYDKAFAAEPKLADDLSTWHRYNAACAAALAGCGAGTDADKLDEKEKARLRGQALGWLRADLAVWTKELAKNTPEADTAVRAMKQHWQADLDLAGVRGPEALAKQPEAERQRWQQLWDEVANMLARALGKTTPEKKEDGFSNRPTKEDGLKNRPP